MSQWSVTREGCVYVASSWKNEMMVKATVYAIRAAGFECYDFTDEAGFGWQEVDPEWEHGTANCEIPLDRYLKMIGHERAQEGFKRDMEALDRATHLVLVLPCGKSAHLEMGYAIGAGKRVAILSPGDAPLQPELMYLAAGTIVGSHVDLLGWLRVED
jgi:hypothetical protein